MAAPIIAGVVSKIPFIGGFLANFTAGAIYTGAAAVLWPLTFGAMAWLLGYKSGDDPVVIPVLGVRQSTIQLAVIATAVAGMAYALARR